MKKSSLFAIAILVGMFFISQSAVAQFPKIKIPKPKPTPTEEAQPNPNGETQPSQPKPDIETRKSASTSSAVAGDDQPTIAKDSIVLTTQRGRDVGGYEKPGWVPAIEYRVNGPIASGSKLSVEFTLAGKPWVSFDCETNETEKGRSWHVRCGGDDIPAGKQMTYAGPVAFTIHLRNELQGTNTALFNGTAKVVLIPASDPKIDNRDWYVDEDWRIPIGYVFWAKDESHGNQTTLHVGFWVRGNAPEVEAHLFYQGKDLAKCSRAGNGAADWNPTLPRWGFINCDFLGVYPTPPAEDEGYDPKFGVNNNPGDYEVKVLLVGHLARSIKFKEGSSGNFDNGIATANKLGTDRVIVPVQVMGDSSGPWNRNAWKTEAFYGNPLTGFSAP